MNSHNEVSTSIRDTAHQDTLRSISPMKRYRRWGIVIIILVAIFAVFLLQPSAIESVSGEQFRYGTVTRGTFIRDMNATGHLVATKAPRLYSSAAGKVEYIRLPGEPVQKGEVLARVTSPTLQNEWQLAVNAFEELQLQQERAQLERRQTLLKLQKATHLADMNWRSAQREWQRAQRAFSKHLISDLDYATAKDAVETSALQHTNATAEETLQKEMVAFEAKAASKTLAAQQLRVDELQRRVSQLTVMSPISGRLGNWLSEQHSQVIHQQALLTVIDLKALEGELNIPQHQISQISLGLPVEVHVGQTLMSGTIGYISPEVLQGNVQVRVTLNEKNDQLRQKQQLRARIVIEEKPNSLIVKKGNLSSASSLIYKVNDQHAVKQPVRFGHQSINQLEILSGLSVGDQLIISDTSELKQIDRVLLRSM